MQVMFLVLFAVSLIFFSLVVREGVGLLPYLLGGESLPVGAVGRGAVWLVLFVASFFGTGLYLYERERDEGRIGRRIRVYEWVLDQRKDKRPQDAAGAKPIRRADDN